MSRTDANAFSIIRRGAIIRSVFIAALASPLVCLAIAVCPQNGQEFLDSWRVFDRIAWHRFLGSLILSGWTIFFAMILAAPVYAACQSVSLRARRWIVIVSLLPLSFPPFGVASGWLTLLSHIEQTSVSRLLFRQRGFLTQWLYNQPGGGWLLALCFWPIVFLMLALSSQPRRSQVDAARLCMTRPVMLRRVLWPAWREPLLAAATVIACLGLLQFETPSLLQLPSYPLEIFTRFSIPENEWKALILCLPYAVIALALAWAFQRAGRCLDLSVTDPPFTAFPPAWKTIFLLLTVVIFVLSVLIPLVALFLHAGSLLFTLKTIASHGGRLFRSVFYAGAGASAIILLGTAYCALRPRRRFVLAPSFFIVLFACPGILIAAGWLQLRSWWPGALPSEIASLSLIGGYVTHRMLVGYAAGILLWKKYGERQREYESLLGLDFFTWLKRLLLPALFRPAMFAVILTALLLWGDIAITILLHPPGGDTLAVEYFNLLHYGNDARTAAIGFLLLLAPAVVLTTVLVIFSLGKKFVGDR